MINPKHLLAFMALTTLGASAATPGWLEADSAAAIESRTVADFPYSVDEFYALAREKYPTLTRADLDEWIAKKYVETLNFGGEKRVFRKALRNVGLLALDPGESYSVRGSGATAARMAYVDSVIKDPEGGNGRRVVYKFSIDVPYHPELDGDTLRVWMPIPMATQRQSDITVLEATPGFIASDGRSVHNTLYFEAPVSRDGNHFEYTARFDTRGQYFSPEYIREHMKPYDTTSDFYKQYTATEHPHIVRLDSLAHAIVGAETDPLAQSELVFDYISHYPWAGAREYSTIECIPTYVLSEGHGDCGQVSLLYISLMRTLGVPARWESGWMIHPGEQNYHDWAEVYFEGVGWVPVDCSFGRYVKSPDKAVREFFSHGMDAHRFATNQGVCGALYPPKRYVRSETVDFQAGEVETTRGNLFYPAWDSSLQLISITPLSESK